MADAHVVTHLRDGLVPGLKFCPDGNSAEYVHSPKLAEIRADVSDRFSLAAGKVIRVRIVDYCWLQSGNVRFSVQLFNKATDALTPDAPSAVCFDR